MAAILSNRTLQFFNNENVFDLSLKKTRFLPQGRFSAEVVVDTGTGETLEEVPPVNIDPLRYLSGLARYKTTLNGNVLVDTLDKLIDGINIGVGLGGITIVTISEEAQFEHRLPFSKIVFRNNRESRKENENESSVFYESFQDIQYHFRSLEWVRIFYSRNVLSEFLERGDFLGEQYQPTVSRSTKELMERCEATIRSLNTFGVGQVSFIKRPPGMGAAPLESPLATPFQDFNIKTLAQVPETSVRMEEESNLEAVSSLRFMVDENYNFLSRQFEFGQRAPSSRFYTEFEESLLPSGYLFSVIKYLESLKDNLLQTGASLFEVAQTEAYINGLKERLFFGPFDLEPYERGSQTGELTRDLYNKFGQSIKNLTQEAFDEALGDSAEQQKRRLVLIDTLVSQNFNFQTLFPFGNRIEITDLPSTGFNLLNILTNYNLESEIMLNLMNGVSTPETNIQSTRRQIEVTEYFTGKQTLSYSRPSREFNFSTIFNNTTQPLTINDGQVGLIDKPEELNEQITNFNSSFITPYRNNLNLINYRNEGFLANVEFYNQFKTTFENITSDNLPNLRELFLSRKNNYFEIFAYKVVKRNTTTGATQQFFVFNRSEEIIEFFDSQVKPNQNYEYSLYALAFILENNYRYNLPSNIQNGITLDRIPNEQNRFVLGANVNTRQASKIIELPIAIEQSTLSDAPPTRPDVSFYPLKEFNDRVRIRLSSMNGSEMALPIFIESGDASLFSKIRQSQKVKPSAKIKFKTDETPAAFEVFRLNRKPESIRDFATQKTTIRSVTSENQSAEGTMFEDRIVPNVDYYYLFRTLDFHGNISNPTEVFKFTMVDIEGALQPLLTTHSLEELFGTLNAGTGQFLMKKKETEAKEVRRFIKIRPNAREISFIPRQFVDKASTDVTSVLLGRGALPTSIDPSKIESQNNILNERYMLELKSKKTGKSIFIEFKYNLNNFNISTRERREMVPDTVTEQDIQDALARRNSEEPTTIELPTIPEPPIIRRRIPRDRRG